MRRFFILLLLICSPFCLETHAEKVRADSLVKLGNDYYHEGRFIDALDVMAEALEAADAEGNHQAYLKTLLLIGNTYTLFADYDQALHYYEQCEQKAAALHDEQIAMKARNNMLICYVETGRVKEAEACYKSIDYIYSENPQFNRFYLYHNQGMLAKVRKDYKLALYMHRQAMLYAREHNLPPVLEAAEMGQLGTICEKMGNDRDAQEWYTKCYQFAEAKHLPGPLTTASAKLSALYGRLGDEQQEMHYYRKAQEYTDSFFRTTDYNVQRSRIAAHEDRLSQRMIRLLTSRNTTLMWVVAVVALLFLSAGVLLGLVYWQNRRLRTYQRLLIAKHKEHSRQLQMQNEMYKSMRGEHLSHLQPSAEPQPDDEPSARCAATDAAEPLPDDNLLTKQQADELLMDIAHVMEDSVTVCNPDFSLSQLARMVSSNTKYVSWVINKTYGKNFKTYLTEYRIREASRLLADGGVSASLTIAAIAEQVGYKSPTAFNQAFRRIYGMTPSAYLKVVKREQSED
ncbi:MAG: helix-turn-helix domain-containing protein [Alloprevotella sp.]